ncbi:MAG: hypothetical protein JSR59_21360 [Proteobacteria bacterium]|nr:hypothetical protein [Pseudomonadota bacterium]
MSGQFDAAMQVLGSAPSFDVARDARGAPSSDGLLVRRGLTRIFLERGDAAGAFAMLPPIQADPDTKFPFDEYLLRGEVLCAVGRRTEGLSSLTKSLEQHAGTDYENSPDLARARAVTGLCAYSNGQREWAAKLAALSSAALAAQPGVSRYYQLPLVQLEAQLQQSRDRRDVRIDRARRATRRGQGAAARGDAAQLESG